MPLPGAAMTSSTSTWDGHVDWLLEGGSDVLPGGATRAPTSAAAVAEEEEESPPSRFSGGDDSDADHASATEPLALHNSEEEEQGYEPVRSPCCC